MAVMNHQFFSRVTLHPCHLLVFPFLRVSLRCYAVVSVRRLLCQLCFKATLGMPCIVRIATCVVVRVCVYLCVFVPYLCTLRHT